MATRGNQGQDNNQGGDQTETSVENIARLKIGEVIYERRDSEQGSRVTAKFGDDGQEQELTANDVDNIVKMFASVQRKNRAQDRDDDDGGGRGGNNRNEGRDNDSGGGRGRNKKDEGR